MEFKEKFIAFVDILGFKNLVRAAEAGTGMPLDDLLKLAGRLRSPLGRDQRPTGGTGICPNSPCLQSDLDFCVTQISDCVLVSSEISPAGIINLVNHCWIAVFYLLREGIMCRGFITKGPIYHTETQMMGSGYERAWENEKHVSAFKHQADERGTPYVEVDKSVVDYVNSCGDWCVKEMFARCVRSDGEITALFPFKRLGHSFVVAGTAQPFDADRERRANANVRSAIRQMQERVQSFLDQSNPSAVRKVAHYMAALDAQLAQCDKTDKFIEAIMRSASSQHDSNSQA